VLFFLCGKDWIIKYYLDDLQLQRVKADKPYWVKIANNFWTHLELFLNRPISPRLQRMIIPFPKLMLVTKLLLSCNSLLKTLQTTSVTLLIPTNRLIQQIRNSDFLISHTILMQTLSVWLAVRSDKIRIFIINVCSEIFTHFLCYIFTIGLLKRVFHLCGTTRWLCLFLRTATALWWPIIDLF
jgi:hypothetical protein